MVYMILHESRMCVDKEASFVYAEKKQKMLVFIYLLLRMILRSI